MQLVTAHQLQRLILFAVIVLINLFHGIVDDWLLGMIEGFAIGMLAFKTDLWEKEP